MADSSKDGKDACGNYVLTIADCKRMIELEFPLTSPRLRKQSLGKVDLLAEVVNRFRDAVHAEADLIEQKMAENDSENWASTNEPKIDYGGLPPCPGCGGPVEQNVECGGYVCYECDHEWEAWELIDKH